MTSSSSIYQIEKLDGKNYSSWKIHIKSILIHSELWPYVIGRQVKTEDMSVEKKAEWDTKDEKALATILLSVKPCQLNHIKNCKSSKDAWSVLEATYRDTGPARKVTLFRQLLHLKLDETHTMTEHLGNFSDIAEKLSEIEVSLPDEVLVIMLLSSLPAAYENFVVAMESRDKLPSMQLLKIKLQEEYLRRNADERGIPLTTISPHSAFSTRVSGERTQTRSGENDYAKRNLSVNRRCYACGKRGHYAANCRDEDAKCKKKTNTPKKKNREAASFLVLTATNTIGLRRHQWCMDSGATAHMCCDKEMFSTLRSCQQRVLLAGGKFIYAVGIGTVLLNSAYCNIELKDVLYIPTLQGNFLSVPKITLKYQVVFGQEKVSVFGKGENKMILDAYSTR